MGRALPLSNVAVKEQNSQQNSQTSLGMSRTFYVLGLPRYKSALPFYILIFKFSICIYDRRDLIGSTAKHNLDIMFS